MTHNYYLYERNGKLSVFPWDYNLAFGAFPMDAVIDHANDTGEVINMGIDSPLINARPEERPLWTRYLADETCRMEYHAAMEKLLKEQFDSGAFENETDRVYAMIRPYIAKDPTAFSTPQEVEKAYEGIKKLCSLRTESIHRQSNGSLAAETSQQDPANRVAPEGVNVTDLGSLKLLSNQ